MKENNSKIENGNRNKLLKVAIQIIMIVSLLALIYVALESVLPGLIKLIANGDRKEMRDYLMRFNDFKGYAVGFLLQFIQIITIFLPSVPIQIATGIVFGVWRGFAVCFLAYVSANAIVFWASRKLGTSLEKLLPTKRENLKNEKKKNAILDSEHPAFMVFLATTFPLLPNGLIPYVAAKTKTRFSSFIIAVSAGCIPTILTLCAVGKELIDGDFLTAVLYTLPLLLLFLLVLWQQKRILRLYSKVFSWLRKRKTARREKRSAQ